MQWIYKIIDGSIDLERILQDKKVFFPNNYGFKAGDTIYFLHIDGLKNRIRWQANVEKADEDILFIEKNYLRLVINQQSPIALSDEYIVLTNIEPEFNLDLNLSKFTDLGLVFAYGSVAKNIGRHSEIFSQLASSHRPQENTENLEKSYIDKLLFEIKEVFEFNDKIADHVQRFFENPNQKSCHEFITKVENFDTAIGIFYDENLNIWYNSSGVIHHPAMFFDVYKKALELYKNEEKDHPLFSHGWATKSGLRKLNDRNAIFSTNIPLLLKLIHFFSLNGDPSYKVSNINLNDLLEIVQEKIIDGTNVYFKINQSENFVNVLLTLADNIQLTNSQVTDYNRVLEIFHYNTKKLEPPKKYKTKPIYPVEEFNIIDKLLNLHHHVLIQVGNLIHQEWFIESFLSHKGIFKGAHLVKEDYLKFLKKAKMEPYREYMFIASSEEDLKQLADVFKTLSLYKARDSERNTDNVKSISLGIYPEEIIEQVSITPYVLVFSQSPIFDQDSIKNYFLENFHYSPDLKWLKTLDYVNSKIKEIFSEEHLISYEMLFQFDWKLNIPQIDLWKYFLDYRLKPYITTLNFPDNDLIQFLNNLD